MSATLDAAPIARYLDDCPVFTQTVSVYPLTIEYTPHSAAPLEEQVVIAVEKLLGVGDILVFLPGAAEIRRSSRALEPLARRANVLVLPLHGDLSPAEQDLAVSPAGRPKVILSTNVAESSVTIEGVRAVVDSGLARIAADSPWTGLPSVEVKKISQASAKQRAGRAARLGPGHVTRLYTEQEFHRLPGADVPEILRRELSQTALYLRAMGAPTLQWPLQWLDPPPEAAWDAASALLDKLAVTAEMASLPLPPRLAKLVHEAKRRGVPERGCAVAAVLSAGERGSSDLLTLIEANWQPQTQRVFDQLRRQVSGRDRADAGDAPLLESLLAAFPDRVARHRRDGELLLASGGSARFPNCRWEFLLAVDIEQRREHGVPLVRLASPIQPDWLLDRATERVRFEWNRTAERVEQVSALLYDQLVIDETRAPAQPCDEAGELLAQKALEAGIARFADPEALAQMTTRAALAGIAIDPEAALRGLCRTSTSFAELKNANLIEMLRPSRLDQAAPAQIKLPGGRQVKVHYEPGKPPWIESRMQDFFGMQETPRIHGNPVVVHLLAPNQRPVQVTTDLKGFWERLYPQVRKELMRRYPRHKWPEKPE
jgi:ATP-dependent helicase HrpB